MKSNIMKNILKTSILTIFISASIAFATSAFAQDPPPPPPGGGHGGGGALPPGGGAPLGEGVLLLISLAAAWSGKKFFDARNKFGE